MQAAEGIGKAAGEKLRHLGPFLIGKAGIFAVGLGVFDVDLLMGNIQIAAVDDGLHPVQFAKIGADIVLPHHAVIQPGKLILGVGSVAAHQIKVLVLGGDDPALVAVEVVTEVIGNVQRLGLCKNGGAGIARLVGAVPEAVVTGKVKIRLLRAHFRLLQTDHIRAGKGAEIQKTFPKAGAQAVDIPGYKTHKGFSSVFSFFLIVSGRKGKNNMVG